METGPPWPGSGGRPHRLSPLAAVLRADNPGPMTLQGTNSYLINAGDGVVVVDPGPDDGAHVDRLAAAGASAGGIGLILLTHRHDDHSGGAARLHALTGAPVRAADPTFCLGGGRPLRAGERVGSVGSAGSVRQVNSVGSVDSAGPAGSAVEVLSTPGHTADSVCFRLTDGSVLTGDTVLGRGSTVITAPDGSLRDYLASLSVLADCGPVPMLPGHGPARPDLAAVVAEYRAHRIDRLTEIRSALVALGAVETLSGRVGWISGAPTSIDDELVAAITDLVYAAVDPAVRPAAEQSVRAQLDYLRIDLEPLSPASLPGPPDPPNPR